MTGDYRKLVTGNRISWHGVAGELGLDEDAERDVRTFDAWLTRQLLETGLGWRAALKRAGFRRLKIEG